MGDYSEDQFFDAEFLHHATNRIHDMPDVKVDSNRPPCINILVPAFDFNSVSAGFFGVFQFALFVSRCGFNVRLVLFDNFYFDEHLFRSKLLNYPGMERLFDDLESVYVGSREKPLLVSPHDNCVASVWYSAYFANKIMKSIGDRPFLYLIQDYETNFYPSGALYQFAENSYDFSYHALFSTRMLQEYMVSNKIGSFSKLNIKHTYFNNACACFLPDKEDFFKEKQASKKKKLVFYSRPNVSRNMFELGAAALCSAYEKRVIPASEWDFVGIGLGSSTIKLGRKVEMRQMKRMNLAEYKNSIAQFDVGLTLMASPHPSLLPFDLAGSGAIVVTNSFKNKNQGYFDEISSNIIAAHPDVDSLVEAILIATQRSSDLEKRYKAASTKLSTSG